MRGSRTAPGARAYCRYQEEGAGRRRGWGPGQAGDLPWREALEHPGILRFRGAARRALDWTIVHPHYGGSGMAGVDHHGVKGMQERKVERL